MGHRPSTRRSVGEMLYDDFEPYKEVSGELRSVYVDEDGSRIILNFSFGSLYFTANPDDDTLYWRDGPHYSQGIDVTGFSPWLGLIGKEMDHAWLTMNRQGYIDGALLSFGSMLPVIALNVIASEIKVSSVGPWHSTIQA